MIPMLLKALSRRLNFVKDFTKQKYVKYVMQTGGLIPDNLNDEMITYKKHIYIYIYNKNKES